MKNYDPTLTSHYLYESVKNTRLKHKIKSIKLQEENRKKNIWGLSLDKDFCCFCFGGHTPWWLWGYSQLWA